MSIVQRIAEDNQKYSKIIVRKINTEIENIQKNRQGIQN